MKTVLFGIALIATLGLCPSLFGAFGEESGVQGQMLSEVLDFGLIDHKGEFHRLKYYDGDESTRCIALFVHGNGCPLVRKRIPELNQLAAKYRGQGVKMALINSNFQDSRDEIVAEAEETGVQLPVLIDADQLVGEMLGLTRTAEMLLIDTKAWRIVFRGALDDRLNYERELSEARVIICRCIGVPAGWQDN
ncbi:MAG: redoxin domain-containing protein [Verrucomicrobia bacterium]|nr:redoxin domain-containing protein [Verrucomicrobiota bacterium]